MQDENSRQAIDGFRTLFLADPALTKYTPCFERGHPFIPELHGKLGVVFQLLGKFTHDARLLALVSAHMKWKSDHEGTDIVKPGKTSETVEVETKVLALQRLDSLRSDTQGIAQGKTDPPEPDIKSEDASEIRRAGRQVVHYLSL